MKHYTAMIPRDPKGYEWDAGDYTPEDGKLFETHATLTGGSYADLQEIHDEPVEWNVNTYDPFVEEPALFRIFAALEPTQEAILRFAHQYGDISNLDIILEEGGLTLWQWKDFISEMRRGVEHSDKVLRTRGHAHNEATIKLLNEMLGGIGVYFRAYSQGHTIGLQTEVYNLFDAMILQLVDSIAEQKRYRNCELCGKPYEATSQASRSDKVFCGDNCRVKAYHRRKKQAVEMRMKGKALREIVKATQSDLDTVKGWVTNVEKRKE